MTKEAFDYDAIYSAIGRNVQANAIRKMSQMLGRNDVIALGAGAPSHETFPIEELAEMAARVIRERGHFALQYGSTRGQRSLLEHISAIMSERGVAATPRHIVVTTGSQQGLDLTARLLIDPGDVALVELPSYIGGTIALHNAGAHLVGVRQDEGGIILEDLRDKIERARAEGRRVKCIYTITNFQNPSGVSLAANRREGLLEIARAHDLMVIEDDPYYELFLKPEGRQRPLASMAPDRVIYLSSFSKVLAPGLRTAWVVAPEPVSEKIELAKEGADLSSSILDQSIVAEALRADLVGRRLPAIRDFYQARYRAMLDALREHAPAGSQWTEPLGGFFVWITLPEGMDATNLLPAAIESGVAYVPGQPFFVDGSAANTMRLAFSKESPERIAEGIRLLAGLLTGARRASES